MIYHCMFEQSGTFKNEFEKLGYEAIDYDIQNEFGKTDFVIDLYKEIEKAYNNEPSIFDDIKQEDYILAFFPCIRFENQILLWFRGHCKSQKKWDLKRKLEYDIKLQQELAYNYTIISKLCIVCIDRNFKLIIENPYSEQHYLTKYWCIGPSIIDKNRRLRGDYFKKPTQYWFINCEPQNNFIFEAYKMDNLKDIGHTNPRSRKKLNIIRICK